MSRRSAPMRMILFLCLLLCAAGCSCAEKPAAATAAPVLYASSPVPTPAPTPITVGGSVMENGTLRAVVEADDFALIEQLEGLRTLDVTGSVCYDAILAYRNAHPAVQVVYTVPIGGVTVFSSDHEAVVPDVPDPQLLSYLPELTSLTVETPLTHEAAAEVRRMLPDAALTYSVSFLGLTVPSEAVSLDLSGFSPALAGEIADALSVLPNLDDVNLNRADGSSDWNLEDAGVLQAVRPSLRVDLNVSLFGRRFSLIDDVVDFNDVQMTPERKDTLLSLLPYLRNAGRLDLENCGLPDEELAALRETYPSPKIVWRVTVGQYSCRTDVKMIRFSMFYKYPMLTDRDTKGLTYCNEVRYLDLGHNLIQDAYFVGFMPDLEVCILAIHQPTDISAFRNCPHLEYAELFNGSITDVSPLAACTELHHLNLCMNKITDITPLYGLTNLERLWISRNPIPPEQIERFKELVPDCVVNTTAEDPTINAWRFDWSRPDNFSVRYALLQKQFAYDRQITSSVDLPDQN